MDSLAEAVPAVSGPERIEEGELPAGQDYVTQQADTQTGIRRVGVVGSGTMGLGIAELFAKSGFDVTVAVSSAESLRQGPARLARALDRAVAKGKLTDERRDAALARAVFTRDFDDLADRQVVVEAVKEDEPLKLSLFAALDKRVEDPDAVLASNTSSIPVARLAGATERPGRVVGLHFFNPVPVLPLVEVVPSLLTDPDTTRRAQTLVSAVGKTAVSSPDRVGFVVNALLFPYLLAAIRMVETGVADAETIDVAMVAGCSHPMGPLTLVDLIGLDVTTAIARALYEEYRQQLYAPPPLLLRMVESGLLGRKSGRGFYVYEK